MNKENKWSLDAYLIYGSSFLRAITTGMVAVLLAIYLMKIGLSKVQIGMVVSLGLFGSAAANIFVTFFGDKIGRRKTLIGYSLLNALGALLVCFTSNFYLMLFVVFFGMINARGKDRGAALVLETAILPKLIGKESTKAFAWYSLIQDIGIALGGFLAGLPTLLSNSFQMSDLLSFKFAFGLYALFMFLSVLLYLRLSKNTEIPMEQANFKLSPEGKKIITKLAAFFSIDSLAGGFLTSTLISYYFYERFHVGVETLGLVFFAARILNACSYFVAVWISKKIGLLNAMVFTHIPSHFFLIGVAFAPTFPIAVTFYLLREALEEMDVPTRQAYVMSVVHPEERTKASGITLMVRMMGWAIAPTFAGYVMHEVSMASPLIIGAAIKITYDLLVYYSFRKIKSHDGLKPAVA